MLALATVGWTATAWAQPSGLQITGFMPGQGCPPEPSISIVSGGLVSIDFTSKFAVAPNQGRSQCTVTIQASVPAGYQFTFADYKAGNMAPVPLQPAQVLFSGRLNGSTSRALVDLSWTIPAATPVTLNQSYTYSGGSVAWPVGTRDNVLLPAGTSLPFSACSGQVATRTVTVTMDIAAASNYVLPWPPPPVGQNEKFYLNAVWFAVKWQPCSTRAVVGH